jgi:phosphoribosylanthranilate isomerase
MAIEQAWPYAVDVNSGVEGEVGRKDRTKLKALFAAIRAAGAEEEEESQCLF